MVTLFLGPSCISIIRALRFSKARSSDGGSLPPSRPSRITNKVHYIADFVFGEDRSTYPGEKWPPSHVGAPCLCHERHASLRDRQYKAVRCQPSERATKFLCQGCLIKKYPSNSPPLLQARHYRCIQKPTSTHRNPLKISYINLNSLKFSPIRSSLGLPGTVEEKFEKS